MNRLGHDLAVLSEWIDARNAGNSPQHQVWQRVGKIGEEFGEAVSALIGVEGQNPRKGITHEIEDVKKELLDVAVTALGAYEHLDGNLGLSDLHLAEHVEKLLARAGLV